MVTGWVDEMEAEVIAYLRDHEGVDLEQFAAAMHISTSLALAYISMLARDGKVVIEGLGVRDRSQRQPV
jgi:hypothetical protein